MLWTSQQQFHDWPFDKEADLETALGQVKGTLFGEGRVYVDVKKLIGEKGKTQNIPDGYLLDFSSQRKPVLYLVEVELAKHDPLRYVVSVATNILAIAMKLSQVPVALRAPITSDQRGGRLEKT